MKIETKTVYACEYCNKISRSKGAMTNHEAACNKNPANHSKCCLCKYLEVNNFDMNTDDYTHHYFTCGFDKKSLSPLRAKRMVEGEKIIKSCDRMMPTVGEGCSNFKPNENANY